MKKSLTILLLLFVMAVTAVAQAPLSSTDRERWLDEIRNLKHDYLAKELDLTREQQNEFFPLYDAMQDEIEQLNTRTRELEAAISSDESASDLQVENAARTVFEQRRAEGQIEMTYFDKFRDILNPRQLLQLKDAERKFTRQLVNQHRRMRSK